MIQDRPKHDTALPRDRLYHCRPKTSQNFAGDDSQSFGRSRRTLFVGINTEPEKPLPRASCGKGNIKPV